MWDILSDTYGDGVILSVGLMFPPEQARIAVELSKRLCVHTQCEMQLSPIQNPPRVRLYETVIPHAEAEMATRTLRSLTAAMPAFSMQWGEVEQTKHFISIWGEINEPLDLFQKAVLEKINPLRHGYFKHKYSEEGQLLTQLERLSVERWGSAWADPYLPHMILAKASDRFATATPEIIWPFKKTRFTGVIVGIKQDHGPLESAVSFLFAEPMLSQHDTDQHTG